MLMLNNGCMLIRLALSLAGEEQANGFDGP
jgi:hypothetical protein